MKQLGLLFCGLLLLLGITSCGPIIQIIDVDVKIPATVPVDFTGKQIAIFNTLFTDSCRVGEVPLFINDSILINKFAEGFKDRLALDLSVDSETILVYNHFFEKEAMDTIINKEYLYQLAEQTGADAIVLIDSLFIGNIEESTYRYSSFNGEYSFLFLPYLVVMRIFDIEEDMFVASLPVADTIFWEVLSLRSGLQSVMYQKVVNSLPSATQHIGSTIAQLLQPQWETQERVLFFYFSTSWYDALEHAFMFEWDDARDIWVSITKKSKNPKRLAYAAYNLAVAAEVTGKIELAKQWLDLSTKYMKIPEITHYRNMLDDRGRQQRAMLMRVE
ncbi:MAG: DUF6340 family protein [Prevotellaceae bacterium]|jgi:hypothetical protein|nr:DUF6340 family protein [Prevotellaceae bacterium]